jgi:hypothetical protein
MEAAYFKAAIPEPYRILGLRLKPLSLGRYRLLRRFGCAFVAEEKKQPLIGDLVLGVLVCSMSCLEFTRFMEAPDFVEQIEQWGNKIGEFNVPEKFKLFADYIQIGSESPMYWNASEGGQGIAANWSQSVEVVLRGQLGWSSKEINEEPLTKALSDYYTWAASQGLIQLMTEAEIEIVREAEKSAKEETPIAKSQSPIAEGVGCGA